MRKEGDDRQCEADKKKKKISPLPIREVEPLQHGQYPPLQWDRTGTQTHAMKGNTG